MTDIIITEDFKNDIVKEDRVWTQEETERVRGETDYQSETIFETKPKSKEVEAFNRKRIDSVKIKKIDDEMDLEKIEPIGDNLIVMAKIMKRKANILLPNAANHQMDDGRIVYRQIYKVSNKLRKEYPDIEGKRCMLNYNLAFNLAGGACLEDDTNADYKLMYVKTSMGLIDYVYEV